MSFKATKNRKEVGEDTFKATERRSYDSTMVYDWQKANEESTALLNTYTTKIQKGEYMSAEDIESYQSAISNYIDSTNNLRGLSKSLGTTSKNETDDLIDDYQWYKTQTDLHSNFKLASEYYSKYDSEDAFKKAVADQKAYEAQHAEWMSYDLEAGKVEIDSLQALVDEIAELEKQKNATNNGYQGGARGYANEQKRAELQARIDELTASYGVDSATLSSMLSEKKAYYTQAERAQKAAELASVADVESKNYDPEFEKYAAQGEAFGEDPEKWYKKAENYIAYARNTPELIEAYDETVDNSNAWLKSIYRDVDYYKAAKYMNGKEFKTYNYYFAKDKEDGTNLADEYLNSIEETLNARQAAGIAGDVDGKPVLQTLFAFEAGIDQFQSGVKGWFADGYTPATGTQMASGMIREDLASTGAKLPEWLGGNSLGQVGYDVLNTTANMLPSILAATAVNFVAPGSGAVVGATLMGGSAGGNAKVEMLNLGYSKEQANAYGAMVAVAEGSMEYFLGGISSLGGKLPQGITGAILTKVDNAFARAAIQLGGSMVSEGFEEGLQTVIEPWLKEIATGVDWEAPNIDEILYSSLLGALSAFGLEGAGVVAGEVSTYFKGKQIRQTDGGVGKLQALGQTFSADTVAYKIASKVNAQTDAYTIGRLLNEVNGTISEQNVTEIANGLMAKGMDKKTATKLARQYQAILNADMNISDEAKKILNSVPGLNTVLRENLINKNTTVYQRTKAYSDLMNLAEETANKKKGKTTESKVDSLESLANAMAARGVDGKHIGVMARLAKEDIEASHPTSSKTDVSPADVELMKSIASEVATGRRESASDRFVKEKVEKKNAVAGYLAEERLGVKGRYNYSNTGATRLASNKKKVNIVGVDSIDKGTLKLKLDDGTVVDAEEISFRSSDEALVYEAVTNMGVSANTAWEIIKGYDPKSGQSGTIYAMGALEAYTYGHNGVKVDEMSKDGFAALLSPTQKNTANRLGGIDAMAKVDAQQKTIDKAVKSVRDEAKSKHKAIPRREGEVVLDEDIKSLTDYQQSQVDVLGKVAEGLGVTFHMFKSKKGADGNMYYTKPDGTIVDANGWYDPETGEIWIDINAGWKAQGTIIFTAAHELTHFIKKWSPAKFKVFADFLMEQYGKGKPLDVLVQSRIKSLTEKGRTKGLSATEIYDLAYEEVIADSCETFLRDSKAAEKIAALREKDVGLANKIKTFLGQMLAKMRKVLADHNILPGSHESKYVAEMTDAIQKLYDLWTDALADAGQAYSTLADIDFATESVAPMLSERTWTASEYVTEREATAKKISEALGVDMKTAYKYIDDINSVARLIADDRARLDYEPNLDDNATVLKPNSEYKYSVDMSTLCAKRLLFTGTFDAIQRALPNTVFDSEDIVALREMMQDRGYEVACGICYVESTRREIGRITQEFIDRYKVAQKTGKPISRINSSGKEVVLKSAGKTFNADKNYTPNLGELNTTDIDIVKRDHREVYDAYLAFMNARGQAKPKLLETRAEYKGEILKHFKAKSAVEARNNAGGLRLQSFSDFEVPHLIDMMQIVMDMSRVGLKSQAYTKVPAFAEVFGDTGVKINLSLIAKGDGLDSNGNLVFDDVEGINHKEAFKLRDKYSKNVGTILVGKTDAHIIAAMADPRIDYIIPFHKSSWKESLYDALGLTGYADYTDFQNEKPIDKDRKIKNFDPSEYWDFSKSGDENAQIYLAKCREDGRIPKFPQFQGYPGYWKLLIDFKMYDNDGVGSPQEVVKPDFNTEASERILREYKGGHKSFPVAKDVVEDFVKGHQDKVKYCERDDSPNAFNPNGKTLKEQLKEALDTSESKDWRYVYVGEFTQDFIDKLKNHIDIKKLPIVMNYRDAYLSMEAKERGKYQGEGISYHNLGVDGLEAALLSFSDPEYVLLSEKERKIELILQGRDYKNRQLFSIVEVNTKTQNNRKFMDVHVVTSVYGNRGLKNRIATADSEGRIIYKKTEESTQGIPQVQYERDINANSSNKSITQPDDSVNRETKKMSDRREVEPIETADYVKMYHHFGSTKNYDVAGYLLGNGMMLDFSGKHWGDDYSTSRQVDHRDIQEVLGNRGSNNGVNAMIDMIGNGNIRLMPEVGGINLAVKPNATQMSQLRGYINHFKGEVEIDIDEVGGDTIHSFSYTRGTSSTKVLADIKAYFDEGIVPKQKEEGETDIRQFLYSDRVADKKTVDFLNEQIERGEYDAETNPDGGYYVTYKSMSFWGYDEDGNAILRSPMAEYVDGKLSGAYLIPKDKNKHIWYQATETIDETTGLPSGLLVKTQVPGKKNPNKLTDAYLPASENQHLIKDDWSNLYFNLKKKIFKNGKWENSDVPARYNPYEHSSNSMLNDQFKVAYLRDNLVTVKMYVPVSEDNGTYRAKWSKDPTGWTDWKSGDVASKIGKQKDLKRRLYLSRYATPVEIVPDSEVAKAYKGYLEGTDVAIPDNVVPPNLLKELKKIGVPIEESGKVTNDGQKYSDRVLMGSLFSGGGTLEAGLVYQMLDKEFAVEYNKKIAATYTDNHGKEHMFVGDVRDFNSKDKQNVFYLHASPVCKNFSPASHSGGETTLDITTAQATARVLEEQMPQVFTVENVKRYIGSEAYNIIINKLNELGYTWDVSVYKASDYGNATKRERMIIRAVRDGELPAKPQKVSTITSWGEATRDLWETDLIPSNLVKSKIEAIKNTPQLKGVKLTKLDKPLLIYDTTKSKTVSFAWADELAPTLTTKCGDARIIMPDGRVYAPTPKFMGRIQGLPDDYKYPKAVTNAFKIIGNGIPTQLTKAVMGGVLDSAYEQTHDGQVLYSDRVTDPDSDANSLTDKDRFFISFLQALNETENASQGISATDTASSETETMPQTWVAEVKSLYASLLNGLGDKEKSRFPSVNEILKEYSSNRVGESAITRAMMAAQKLPNRKYIQDGMLQIDELIRANYSEARKFSDRYTTPLSTRSLLADALETTAQNDIERNKLEQYKNKIDLIESEQEKLTKLKAEIKALSFAKGSRDTARIKQLQFEANQTANRINVYDRQLLNLESTTALKNVLNREKELARRKEAQKGKEALAKYRERAAKTQRELMERNTESRKKAIEGRDKTAMRHKIRNIVEDLNNLLLNPTKDKHVPIGLQKPVAAALAVINMDTVGADERIAKYNDLIAKSNNPDEIARLTKSRDNIEYQGENLKDKLVTLQNAYASLLKSDDPLVKNAHNEAIENLIENTVEKVGDTSLRNMSLEQLEAVYDMFKAIKATVRNANKMFKESKQETITDNSEAVKKEVRAAGGHRERVLKATKFLKKFGWNMLKPIYAMKLIGSDTLTRLYENVRKGEDTWAVDVNEAKDFFKETAKKYEYNVWDFEKQYKFADSAGHSFSLTLEQIMSLYAYSKREQADKHLEFGGFIFDDSIEVTEKNRLGIPMTYEVNDANPYRLKKEDLGKIIDLLESQMPNVKGFVDEMQAYLSDVMGAKGNEVSLAMYDIKLYKEQNYFPLKTAKYFREFDPEKNGTPKIKNSGFSKKTVPQAGNPIILSNFMDVWANHVNDMSMYHAFVLPLEDFMRVYNYSSTAGGYDSVQQYIKNAYGSQANTYIETLMNDLNGGARTDPATDFIGKGMSLFKKAAVFASASVVIQQPSAIARALAYVDAKYFVGKPDSTKHKETWAEVKKYAPVAIIKEMGYFDTNMGRSTIDWIKEEKTWRDKVDELASKPAAFADEISWCAIWNAVKREVADSTNLKVGSEEFLKMAGKRFTEIVTKTQVYDSVLSRSALMRSKDSGAKMVTAFMAEPTTSLNMVVDAIIEGKRGNKAFAKKAVGAVAASIILNSILVSLVTAARDDDDDETYTEKYLESLTAELLDGFNPLTYIPLIKDIWSIMQGYDIERSDMSIWSDLWQSVENLFSDNKSGFEKTEGIVGSIASIFGLPAKNLMRDARAIYNLASTLLSGTPTTWTGAGNAIGGAVKDSIPLYSRFDSNSKSEKLYDAIVSGDQKHIERMKAQYEDDKEYQSAVKSALRENDPRIQKAVQAVIKGKSSERIRIQKEIIAEGHFKQDIVVTATNAELQYVRQKINDARKAKKAGKDDEYTSIIKTLVKRGYPKDFITDALK